jgi:hypothetical protein
MKVNCVNWDDDIPNMMGKKNMFQTTNQKWDNPRNGDLRSQGVDLKTTYEPDLQ